MATIHIILGCVLFSVVSAQFAATGVCNLYSQGAANCYNRTQGCPAGSIPHPSMYLAPWACGGWLKVCCLSENPVAPPPPFDDTNCGLGVPTSRILRGSNTSKCDWPYVASIRFRTDQDSTFPPITQVNSQHGCAAVIIDQNWVLTHPICCYTGNNALTEASNNIAVVAGEYDTSVIDDDPTIAGTQQLEQFIPIQQCFVHPDFTDIDTISSLDLTDLSLVNGNALALLKLSEPINNNCASTACLPNASPLTSSGSCDTFDQCVILGWGFETEAFTQSDLKLKRGFVRIYKDDVCDLLQGLLFNPSITRPQQSACQIPTQNQDACLGDQGGPVLCYDGSRWSVQGVLPFNLCKDDELSPYVIDVSSSDTWIYDTIRSNS